ncbi:MAG: hypothetical protein ACLSBB_17655 [Ruthenibacterium lactatiformans]
MLADSVHAYGAKLGVQIFIRNTTAMRSTRFSPKGKWKRCVPAAFASLRGGGERCFPSLTKYVHAARAQKAGVDVVRHGDRVGCLCSTHEPSYR